eukprot:Skav227386  [mRNA]  locus=scaffold3148:51865:81492:+ [translate_table: standard]
MLHSQLRQEIALETLHETTPPGPEELPRKDGDEPTMEERSAKEDLRHGSERPFEEIEPKVEGVQGVPEGLSERVLEGVEDQKRSKKSEWDNLSKWVLGRGKGFFNMVQRKCRQAGFLQRLLDVERDRDNLQAQIDYAVYDVRREKDLMEAKAFALAQDAERMREIDQAQSVLVTFAITVVVVLALMLFACQTKYDFTGLAPYFFVATLCLCGFGITLSIASAFGASSSGAFRQRIGPLYLLYAAGGAILFSGGGYIVFDTQLIVGGKHAKYRFNIDDYCFDRTSAPSNRC